MNKLVSVNVTTFNRADLLPRCLDSILGQTYTNIEVVVVDDCSNDNTKSVVDFYRSNDSRIKYIRHQKNLGNAFARNTALSVCTGYYVAFMDDDDEWIDLEKIRKQVAIFELQSNERIGVVCSGVTRVNHKGEEQVEIAEQPKCLVKKVLAGGLIHNSTAMTKRDIMLKVKGFDTKLPRGIDSEFFRRLIVKYGFDVFFMDDITCKYYEDSPNRISLQNSKTALGKSIVSHFLNLKKYIFHYLLFPKSFLIRIRKLSIVIIKYLRK